MGKVKAMRLINVILSVTLLSGLFVFTGPRNVSIVFAAATQVNDDQGDITYSGSWTDSNSSSGYINNDCHYSASNGSYAQFTFTGTSIKWIGAKNTDHGYAEVYIDDTLQTTISTYATTWMKQQSLYEKTGLAAGSHRIKIVVKNTKESGSSNYFQDIDAFEYDSVTPTPTPTPAGTKNAYSQIEAESFDSKNGSQVNTCGEGGQMLNYIANGNYAVYNNVDFGGGAISFQARVASGAGGNIEVRLDGATGTLVGTCTVGNTGGWGTWTTLSRGISGATGIHNLYLVFTGTHQWLFDFNWFKFTSGTATPTLTPTPTPGAYSWFKENDNNSSITYSANVATATNPDYYMGDMHYSNTVGEYAQYTFTGPGVRWIGGKNTDHGSAEVYIDGVFKLTVNSYATSWLKQQVLYENTSLENKTHTLKVVVSTSGFQDFDAFEYYGTPPAQKMIGNTVLPNQVAYLNGKHQYPVGNGIVAVVGDANGGWSRLIGPGYTSPNFISSETIKLIIDGTEQTVTVDMRRAEKTGIYYGVWTSGDIKAYLIDNARWGDPWLSRLIMIDNTSATTGHNVSVRAYVTPQTGSGKTNWLVKDSNNVNCGAGIKLDTTVPLVYCGNNVANKYAIITFNDSSTTASLNGGAYTIDTGNKSISAGGSYNVSLCHYVHLDGATTDSLYVSTIRGMNITDNAAQSITTWQNWFDNVAANYRLSKITDQRAHDLVEGGLAVIKTNQSQDGGMIAHTTFYTAGYMRDAALGLRGMIATGHTSELQKWLYWVHHKYGLYGYLPDSSTCSVNLTDPSNKFDLGNMNVEQTALYILCARDYHNATGDLATLNSINNSLKYCMDIQLKQAVNNGYKLEFNGDETEICGAIDVSASGIQTLTGAQQNYWSMSSIALCAAALDFYIQYLNLRGDNPSSYYNSQSGTTMNLNTELTNLKNAMGRDYWRTDVAELPNGFHDFYRKKADNSLPLKRIVNFTLMPAYFGTPYAYSDRKAKDVSAMYSYFNSGAGFLQLVPGADTGFDGHNLGYLLWGLIEIGDSNKTIVYNALVNGSTADCWGLFDEAYSATGSRNGHDLRTFETGCNISAIAKYWDLHQ